MRFIRYFFLLAKTLLKLFYVLMRATLGHRIKSTINVSTRNNPLLILGNGPSLSEITQKIEDRKKVDLCTVNFSVLTDLFYELKPEYHLFADGAFFYNRNNKVNEVYDHLVNKIDWHMELLVPLPVISLVEKDLSNNTNIIVKGYNVNEWETQLSILKPIMYYFYSKSILSPPIQNVCVSCIFNGINMGYKTIYLYGVEHSWTSQLTVRDDNVVCFKDEHYYNEKASLIPFYKSDPDGYVFNMYEALMALSKMFYGYMCLREYADYLGGIRIINKTKGSFIDAFERE